MPIVVFTVPRMSHALLHAANAKPLARIPRKQRQKMFVWLENLEMFDCKSSVSLLLSVPEKYPMSISGIMKITAQKKERLVVVIDA